MSCDGVLDESRVMQGASIDPKNNTVLVTPPNSYSMSSQSRPSLATCPEALLNDIVLKLTTLQTQFSAIQGIRTDLSQVKSDIAEMRSSIDSKLDSLAGRMNAIESRVGVLEESKMELDEVKKAINGVIIDTRRNEQWARRSNIQINGVPETRGENLVSIVKTLAALSGFELNTSTDVDFVTRVAVRNDTDSAKPKPIVLKMQARYKKDDFISALRKLKNLKASDIGFANCSNRIYINDHLSAFNKYLLREAKRRANQKQYQFCWVLIICVICMCLSPSIFFVQSETALYVAEAVYRVFLTLIFYIACVGVVDSYPANLRCTAHGLIMSVAYLGGAAVRGIGPFSALVSAVMCLVMAAAAAALATRLP
ncbi:hypothetical protein MSG28_015003 [Choristoneura fumiferana]|uniref:Uncharacterized protein n=1 Tax=Choristoneura fumiferana TaxID=7141 RepID=A0ACC0KY58_CHOFU|nr:hypothetical protein MSG28_015003 [Choristoneura fumiferana]